MKLTKHGVMATLMIIVVLVVVSFAFATRKAQSQELVNPVVSSDAMPNTQLWFSQAQSLWGQGDYAGAVKIWKRLANEGNKKALWTMATINLNDNPYTSQNSKQAIFWLLKLSEMGVADAKELIGDIYYYGNGVEQDRVLAKFYYEDYAKIEQDPDIMTRYAILIATGNGAPIDRLKAWKMVYVAAIDKEYLPAYLIALQLFNDMSTLERFLARMFMQERAIQQTQ